jgi:hypothetical protein
LLGVHGISRHALEPIVKGLVMRAGDALRVAHLIEYSAAHRNFVFSKQGVISVSMDRAAHALCWHLFTRQIGHLNALKLNVTHQIKAY